MNAINAQFPKPTATSNGNEWECLAVWTRSEPMMAVSIPVLVLTFPFRFGPWESFALLATLLQSELAKLPPLEKQGSDQTGNDLFTVKKNVKHFKIQCAIMCRMRITDSASRYDICPNLSRVLKCLSSLLRVLFGLPRAWSDELFRHQNKFELPPA